MKRLYIIGNGFDRAHDLKTSFSDFMLYHLKKMLQESMNSRGMESQNEYLYAKPVMRPNRNFDIKKFKDAKDINELLNEFDNSRFDPFYDGIYRNIMAKIHTENWADVEGIYFKALNDILVGRAGGGMTANKLNDSLSVFALYFRQYLHDEVQPTISENLIREDFNRLFSEDLNIADSTLVLNFNYTNTPELYINKSKIAYIHGSVAENNIWLGYGDEHNEVYKDLENKNEFEFLRFQKSNKYALSPAYGKLISFMNAKPVKLGVNFEVIILGHSCALSDRTLLKEIFNHKHCYRIRYFHHIGEKQYLKNFVSLSRHFDDKTVLRRKIEPWKEGVDFISDFQKA